MVNPFLIPDNDGKEDGQPRDLQLATVAGIYSDGLSLIPDDQSEAMQKHYKYLSSTYPAPAVGDRVVIMKMSGTYIVVGALGGSASLPAANKVFAGPASGDPAAAAFRSLVAADLPVVPIGKGGTGQTGTIITTNVSDILVPASGFSINYASFAQYGKLAVLSASITAVNAVTTTSWTTWATIVSGKRPPFLISAQLTRTSYCEITTNGEIQVSSTAAAGNTYIVTAAYLLA